MNGNIKESPGVLLLVVVPPIGVMVGSVVTETPELNGDLTRDNCPM